VATSQAALTAAARSLSQLRTQVPRLFLARVSATPRTSTPAARHTDTARGSWKSWVTMIACVTPKIRRARTQVS